MEKSYLLFGIALMLATNVLADDHTHPNQNNDTLKTHEIRGLEVVARKNSMRRMSGAMNSLKVEKEELFKAACCNLGESFTTNPSVDVNYSDATTGAQQIKLLGLSGTYVQMLGENLPAFRGSASPFALRYVPGPWMKSILVSKGNASVKNGYEGITGQINVEYLKPEDPQGMEFNLFGNTDARFEANMDANLHLKNNWSSVLMGHYENESKEHDSNHDGFMDAPKIQQVNLMNRWLWMGDKQIFHGGISTLHEKRNSGSMSNHDMSGLRHFGIGIETHRYEAYIKHAFILDKTNGTNIALLGTGAIHRTQAEYGDKAYQANEKNLYLQLAFETNWGEMHNLAAGVSMQHDYLGQYVRFQNDASIPLTRTNERETTGGIYAQYTLNINHQIVAMAGLRADNSNLWGTFITPRLHLKYQPVDLVGFRISAGKGYRTVHALAENHNLLSSGRKLIIDDLKQEDAWNYGITSSWNIPLFKKTLKLNAEYYYTRFGNQVLIDYDRNIDEIFITNLQGKSYSHTFQIDVTYPLLSGLDITAAYRYTDVKATYGGVLQEKPLTSKYKGLFTASYKTPLGKWQMDATLQLNGGGRLPKWRTSAGISTDADTRYSAFGQLNAQITRWFRTFSVYVGGENLTGFTQQNPIIDAQNPWSDTFDPALVWGPTRGAMVYAGVRIKVGK